MKVRETVLRTAGICGEVILTTDYLIIPETEFEEGCLFRRFCDNPQGAELTFTKDYGNEWKLLVRVVERPLGENLEHLISGWCRDLTDIHTELKAGQKYEGDLKKSLTEVLSGLAQLQQQVAVAAIREAR